MPLNIMIYNLVSQNMHRPYNLSCRTKMILIGIRNEIKQKTNHAIFNIEISMAYMEYNPQLDLVV